MAIGINIKRILRNSGITIKQLSELSGISVNTLYSITKRDPKRIDKVICQKIAEVLNVSTDEIKGDGSAMKTAEHIAFFEKQLKAAEFNLYRQAMRAGVTQAELDAIERKTEHYAAAIEAFKGGCKRCGCGGVLIWQSDFDFQYVGKDGCGIVHNYKCNRCHSLTVWYEETEAQTCD